MLRTRNTILCLHPVKEGINAGIGRPASKLLALVLVLADLPIELVHQLIDGRVEALVGHFAEDPFAFAAQRHLCGLPAFLLFLLLHRQQDSDSNHLVEMTKRTAQLVGDVLPKSRSHLQMMSLNCQVHAFAPVFNFYLGKGNNLLDRTV